MDNRSLFLKRYKKKHGRENQFFITSYIGIGLIDENTVKPENLSTTWKPRDINNSKNESKRFIKRASLVYSISIFESFITDVMNDLFSNILTLNDSLTEVFKQDNKSIYRKIDSLVRQYPELKTKNYYLTNTAIFWRNNLVHNQKKKLTPELKSDLRSFKDDYYNKNSGLIIEDLISHFNNFEVPTFKEVLSIMATARNFAEEIDSFFMKQVNVDTYIEFNVLTLFNEGKIKNLDNGNFNWVLFFDTHLGINHDLIYSTDIWQKLSNIKNKDELKYVISKLQEKYNKN